MGRTAPRNKFLRSDLRTRLVFNWDGAHPGQQGLTDPDDILTTFTTAFHTFTRYTAAVIVTTIVRQLHVFPELSPSDPIPTASLSAPPTPIRYLFIRRFRRLCLQHSSCPQDLVASAMMLMPDVSHASVSGQSGLAQAVLQENKVASSMWYMSLHTKGALPGGIPSEWLGDHNLFVCPRCFELVAKSRQASHLHQCSQREPCTSPPSPAPVLPHLPISTPPLQANQDLPTFEQILASGKVPLFVSAFLAGGKLIALSKNKEGCLPDVRPIAMGETLRRLTEKCICAILKKKISSFFQPSQFGAAFLNDAGTATAVAKSCKHVSNGPKCQELGWVCVPLAIEIYGNWGREANITFSCLASRLAVCAALSKNKVTADLYGRLSLILTLSVARAILARSLPQPSD
ncbi:hypothetical protein EMCRGX_G018775 [Ephydatia muelleri]